MSRVKLDGIRKVYENGYTAVHGISLDVNEGEFVVLVGPSGCGKSTTLRMIAGLESVSEGTLSIGERVVNDLPARDRDIAMVFQSYALYPHMTVRDNLAFALKLRKRPKAEVEERVTRAAAMLGLAPVLDRRPAELSGGQRQRVALGRALVREPRVFLFDEPLSNLDAKLRGQMRKEIAALHRQLGTTSIYVTHDQTEAMTLGDRIVVMNGGRVEQVGPPMELYRRPANRFVAGFLGSPPMNFIPGRIERGEGGLAFAAVGGGLRIPFGAGTRAPAGERAVVLGIRPEDVYLDGAAPPTGAPAALTLEAAETMGNETIVTLRAGVHEVVARVPPRPLPAPGEPIDAAFDLARLHFFDPDTGAVLGPSTAPTG
jgi:multiple sugar transport system ATP-binding protein